MSGAQASQGQAWARADKAHRIAERGGPWDTGRGELKGGGMGVFLTP